MAATKRSGRSRTQDRGRVAAGQKYEVAYMARKTGSTVDEVKSAIKKAGSNMRTAVESALGGKKTSARKSSAKKSSAKKTGGKSSARKSTAKKSSARKSTAKKSSAKGAAGRKSSARKTGAKSGAKRGAKKAAGTTA